MSDSFREEQPRTQLELLRKKLALLDYNDPVEADSMNLVEKLLGDLIHTTESYRAMKENLENLQQVRAENEYLTCVLKSFEEQLTDIQQGASEVTNENQVRPLSHAHYKEKQLSTYALTSIFTESEAPAAKLFLGNEKNGNLH
jgi:hypothetical protein